MSINMSDRDNLPVKYKAVNISSSGANALIAAVTGKKIRVLALQAQAITAVSFNLESATTDISGVMALGAAGIGGVTLPMSFPYGWCETAEGVALNGTLSSGVAVGVTIVYVEV